MGHISKADDTNYNIPPYCVFRPSSFSTKLVVVFDASCRTSWQTIQNNLLITLLRFRSHSYGVTADIIKVYRQVLVHPKDIHLHLFLWIDDSAKPIKTYAINTVTFETASVPYLIILSLHYAAVRFPKRYEGVKGIIMNDFYVDNMVTGADDLASLKPIIKKVTKI